MSKNDILKKMKDKRTTAPIRWAVHILESLADKDLHNLIDLLCEFKEYKPKPSEELKALK